LGLKTWTWKGSHKLPFSCPCRSIGKRSEVVRLGKCRFGRCNYFLWYSFPWPYGKDFTTIGHYKNTLIVFLPLLNWFHSILVNFFIGYLKFHVFMFAMSIAQIIVFLHFKMCHTCVNILIYHRFYSFMSAWCVWVKWWNIYPWFTLHL
jgi:hypothetical protein